MYDHIFYKQVQINRSDIRPHIKWAVSLVILHMVTSIFLQGLCGYIWVNILTLSPRRDENFGEIEFKIIRLSGSVQVFSASSFKSLYNHRRNFSSDYVFMCLSKPHYYYYSNISGIEKNLSCFRFMQIVMYEIGT